MKNKAIFLMGPTASGKSVLAMEIARRLPVDIISVDSMMVYRGMDIGTGKPTYKQLIEFPHALINICEPTDIYSVAKFCIDAKQYMKLCWQKQRIPLLVGGTMLYFKSLLCGLSELPPANQQLRKKIKIEGNLYKYLKNIDPQAATHINKNDTQRLIRALEINLLTGKTLQQNLQTSRQQQLNCIIKHFAIFPNDRSNLHACIERRFDRMLNAGLIFEVQQLLKYKKIVSDIPAARSVGYKQVKQYLKQNITFAQMRSQAIAATRQLAKSQYTWLRNWPDVKYLQNSNATALDTIIYSML